ncbi:phosphoesterase [Thermoplasmatales archaeon SW_10_69_26]|nr:MAG: phosphoesterase [Thermoplasmatales archaeon SW_10_69_26]
MSTRLVPLFDERAMLVETSPDRVLVAGDLHLGMERELRKDGVHGIEETEGLIAHLGELAAEERVDRVLLLGDVKHTLGAWEPEKRALSGLAELPVPVEVVPGNHDGEIDEIAPFLKIHDARGLTIGEVGFLHGHTWPNEEITDGGRLVLSHNHPHVALRDGLGQVSTEPCWVRAPIPDSEANRERYPDADLPGEAVLVPAFNPLLGGVALNRPEDEALGPLLTNDVIDLGAGRVYTLDGVELGTIADLEERLDDDDVR